MHGLVPPHPGPLVAIDALKANLGITLGLRRPRRPPDHRRRRSAVREGSPAAGSTCPPRTCSTPTTTRARPCSADPRSRITLFAVLTPGRPDDGQGARRHLRRRRTTRVRTGARLHRHPARRAAHRRHRRHVHPRPRRRAWARKEIAKLARGVAAARSPASCSSSPPVVASSRPSSTPASASSSPTGCESSGISVLLLAWVVAVLIRLATGLGHRRDRHGVRHPRPARRRA